MEEQLARADLGLSLEEYNSLPGTREWIEEGGPLLSKSDVIAIFRLKNLTEAVQFELGK